MSLMDKIKGMVGTEDDYDYPEDDFIVKDNENRNEYNNYRDSSKNKVVNINATTQLKVILVKPEHRKFSASL